MIKLFAAGGLVLVSFYLGINVEKYYKKRFTIFKDFYDFLQYARREIAFLKTDIITVAQNFAKDKKGSFAKLLCDIKDYIKDGKQVKIENAHLNNDEKNTILRFFDSISKSDFVEQAKLFDRYSLEIGEKVKQSEKQKKEKGELFKKLIILIGIGLLIMLI